MKTTVDWEQKFADDVAALNLPAPQREFRFYPARKWRVDFAWPERKLLVEVEGGTWAGGRHTTGAGFEKDCEKYNTAAVAGFVVIRITSGMIKSGEAIKLVESILRGSI